jgi:hypothetical protein
VAAWLTVYCAKPIRQLAGAELRKGIDPADWYTLAEGQGIDDDAVVKAAVSQLRIADDGSELRCRPDPKLRPVQIHLWSAQERLAEERREVEERLVNLRSEGAERVRAHLERTISIVALELGFPMLERMEIVFAWEVAMYLAETYDGLVSGLDNDWYDADRHRFQPFLREA